MAKKQTRSAFLKMVDKSVTEGLKGQGPRTPVEMAFVQALYKAKEA